MVGKIALKFFYGEVYRLPKNLNIFFKGEIEKKMNKSIKTILPNKNGRKSASGITLIALIITVIVLLILARSNNFSYYWK